jgi:hypothetical protein
MKMCIKCGLKKHILFFNKNKFSKDGLKNYCKNCESIYNKIYRNEHKDILITKDKEKYNKNRSDILINKQEYYIKNKKTIIDKNNNRTKIRRKVDISFKLRNSVSSSINTLLHNNKSTKNGNSCFKYLDYNINDLKYNLEQQFDQWMTWYNYGKYDSETWDDNDPSTWKWNLDHIIPQSCLPYISMEDENFKKCWALENLRPLSAKQNIKDGNRRNA